MRRLNKSICVLAVLIAAVAPVNGAIIYVDTLADYGVSIITDGECTLREAMLSANADLSSTGDCVDGSSIDTIVILVGGTISVSTALPQITEDLIVVGPGASFVTIDAALPSVFSGSSNVNVAVRGLTISGNGGTKVSTTDGSLVVEHSILDGSRIVTSCNGSGGLAVRWVTIRNSSGSGYGGGADTGDCNAEIRNTTFENNSAPHGGGALVISRGQITQSTFEGNTTAGFGGAILSWSSAVVHATVDISSSTIVGNSADTNFDDTGRGGGVFASGTPIVITNTVVAQNTDWNTSIPIEEIGPDANVTSGSHNFIGDNTGATTVFPTGNPNAGGDYVGDAATPLDPRLDPLGDNGGPTFTMLPQVVGNFESPLIDAGSCSGEFIDQRGGSTPIGGVGGSRQVDRSPVNADDACDIGAVERGDSNFGSRNIAVRARAWLQGPYSSTTGLMNTDLTVPNSHPYTGSPWNIPAATNDNVSVVDEVDWVVVHLFEGSPLGPTFTKVASLPALLRNNGLIADAADASDRNVEFEAPVGMYWVVVDHRNHVSVMFDKPLPIDINTDVVSLRITADLRTGDHYGDEGQVLHPSTGVYGLFSGDGTGNNQVQNDDKNLIWAPQNGLSGYRAGDFNMNGQVQNDDKNVFWEDNNGIGTKVPIEQ